MARGSFRLHKLRYLPNINLLPGSRKIKNKAMTLRISNVYFSLNLDQSQENYKVYVVQMGINACQF